MARGIAAVVAADSDGPGCDAAGAELTAVMLHAQTLAMFLIGAIFNGAFAFHDFPLSAVVTPVVTLYQDQICSAN